MPDFNVDELIKRFGELREGSSDRYLNGILNFFKWTTTFAFAVVIWIGSNFQNVEYESNWLLLSVFFVVVSITIAIITTHFILDFWSKDWKLKFHMHQLIIFYQVNEKHPSTFNQEALDAQRKKVLDASPWLFELKRYDNYLIFHISSLLIGIIFYLFAVFL